jgi:Holliday junction DNA helicase RuvA
MIDFISGKIVSKAPTRVVVECSGIGYNLFISTNTYRELPAVGENTILKTYLHVREDILQLFAFFHENERTVFESLISVSGIGPRLAQTILSGLQLEELTLSILRGNIDKLTSISGVGSKTAQRLVVELKEKFSQLGLITEDEGDDTVPSVLTSMEEEALLALMSLGYKRQIVERALNRARNNGDYESVEDLIKVALQLI